MELWSPDSDNTVNFSYSDEIEAQRKELGLPKPVEKKHPLDSPKVRKRFRLIMEWWNQAYETLRDVRAQAMRDHDIYDGDQWLESDAQTLKDRGQAPLVFNFIKPTVDWLLGSEKKTRVDYKCLPRGKEDAPLAETKTKLLKYLQDVNNSEFGRSRAFADMVVSGLGWTEHGYSDDGDDDRENVFERYEDWRNIWFDPLGVDRGLSDARYLFRGKWVDLDIATTYFPERANVLKSAAMNVYLDQDSEVFDLAQEKPYTDQDTGDVLTAQVRDGDSSDLVGSRRPRVYLLECWYRMPVRKKVVRGEILGAMSGIDYDPESEAQQQLLSEGLINVYDFLGLEMRIMIFCGNYVLVDQPSPYRHNRFPFVPWWGFRKKRNNAPYGIVRNLRDPQDDLNKRRSKALHILSTNKMLAEDDAFDDWEEAAEEKDRPDGILKYKKGSRIELHDERGLAKEHVLLMDSDERMIQSVSGITDELMGRETNAVSGRAIEKRQEQGLTVTAELFDNYRYAFKLSGEIQLSLIEQFFSDQKTIRITGDPKSVDYLEINTVDEQTGEMINDISAAKADFVIDEHNYSASVRQAMFESMMELLPKMQPEVAMGLLDIVVDISDLPGKEVFVKRIREITGHDTPEENLSPEEIEAKQKAEEEAAEKQRRAEEAELEKAEAEADKLQAEAEKAAMETELTREKIQSEKIQQQVTLSGAAIREKQASEQSAAGADGKKQDSQKDQKPTPSKEG